MANAIFVLYRDGKERPMKQKLAEHLQKAGKGYIKGGNYLTRDMRAAPLAPPPATPPATTPAASGPSITPAAQKLAEQHGLDINKIVGTGNAGKITVGDVEKLIPDAE